MNKIHNFFQPVAWTKFAMLANTNGLFPRQLTLLMHNSFLDADRFAFDVRKQKILFIICYIHTVVCPIKLIKSRSKFGNQIHLKFSIGIIMKYF